MQSEISAGNFYRDNDSSSLAEPQGGSEYDADGAAAATTSRRNRFTASVCDAGFSKFHAQSDISGL